MVWSHGEYTFDETVGRACWRPYGTAGLQFVDSTEGDDNTVQVGVENISYSERKAPFSNDCVARNTGFSQDRPRLDYWETDTHVSVRSAADGTRYIADYSIERNVYAKSIVGFPSNIVSVTDPWYRVKDWKTAYISAMTGQRVGESLANAVLQTLELKDWPDTIKMVFDLVSFLRKPRAQKLRRLKRLTSKDVASSYLAYTYGVEPTIPQIKFFLKEFKKGLEEARTSLTRLATNARQAADNASLRKRSDATVSSQATLLNRDSLDRPPDVWREANMDWSEPIVIDRVYSAASGWQDPPHHEVFLRRLEERCHTFCAAVPNELKYYSTFDAYQLIQADLFTDVIGQIVGLIQPMSNIWAIFPLSFVVDWFVNMEGALQRLDMLVASAKVPKPIDGVWYSARFIPWVGTSLPYSLVLEPEVIPTFGVVDGEERIVALTVRQTYNLIGDEDSCKMHELIDGLWYDRHPVRDVSEWELLLPNIQVNLNFSKVLSLGALAHPK